MTPTDISRSFEPLAATPRLPKLPAVKQLAERLASRGYPINVAAAISRAVVDPAYARSRLEHLTPLRVPGGTVLALDCLLWAPALVPYPVNSREASKRHFPAGSNLDGAGGVRPPVRPPVGGDSPAELHLRVEDRKHLVWSLDRSMAFLQDVNSWNDSISEQGVMVPVVAAVATIEHDDGSPPATVITTPDGSSRTASALSILGLEPAEVAYDLPADRRAFRSFLQDVQSVLDRPADEASEDEIAQLRALQIPARLLLDFRPNPATDVDFATAVDSLVHLVHVEAPKEWDDAGQYDAKAEAVLDSLEEDALISDERRDYLAGMLTPDEAAEAGFSPEEDARAASIIRMVKRERFHESIKQGIRILNPDQYANKWEKVKIAVELALRARRATMSAADARIARTSLRSAYLQSDIWARPWSLKDTSPGVLRRKALKELEEGVIGPATRELAAYAVYWLGVHGILREAHFFPQKSQRDGRTPQRIIDAMLRRPWGIEVLHRAVIDGRDGEVPRQVDADGRLIKTLNGEHPVMSNGWLRGQVVPEGAPIEDSVKSSPISRLRTRTSAFSAQVGVLEQHHEDVRSVRGDNDEILIDSVGWNEVEAEQLRERLQDLGRRLIIYGHVWSLKHSDEELDDDEAEDDEGD